MAIVKLGRVRQGIKATGGLSKTLRPKLRRAARRNRALVIALLAVGGVVVALTGIGGARPGNWFIQVPLEIPSPRFGAATAWDEANSNIVVFGGFGHNVGTGLGVGSLVQNQVDKDFNRGDTWLFNYSNDKWGKRSPINSPSPRGYAAMAYDGARKNTVLFGGARYRATPTTPSGFSGETWTWDGQDWTLQNPPEPRPEPRRNAVMAYDAHRKVVVMFGGQGVAGTQLALLNDTWTWDGSAWKIMPSGGAPSPRHSAAMAYDVCNAQAVMFGGVGSGIGVSSPPGETWILDGAGWTGPMNPTPSPSRRIGASMAYSPKTGRVLMYGGLFTDDVGVATAAVDPDVWRWDGATTTWEKMNSEAGTASGAPQVFGTLGLPVPPPPPRAYASFARHHLPGDDGWNPPFVLIGGTPWADLHDTEPQAALPDYFIFSEHGGGASTDDPISGVGETPLTRRCVNPVPIPSEATITQAPEAPKTEVREGMREIAQLPVLLGTDWPSANRDFNAQAGGSFSSPYNPNPKYTPPPDCPNYFEGDTGYNTNLVTDSKRNRVYQFFRCDYRRGRKDGVALPLVHRVLIEAYDGTTLKRLGSAPVTLGSAPYNGQFVGEVLVHDAGRGRFLLRTTNNDLVFIQQDLIEKGVDPVVKKITLTGSIATMSFFDHPQTGLPKLLINRGGSLQISQLDLPLDLDDNTVDVDWNVTLTGCASIGGMKPMRSGNRVYIGCSGSTGGTNRMGVVRVPITENEDGSETPGTVEAFPGPFNVSENWNDPQAERMVLQSGGASPPVTVWVFDGKTSRYVGFAGIKQVTYNFGWKFTFDPEIGRLYALITDEQNFEGGRRVREQGGVLILDTRLTPVSQALKFPQFAAKASSGWGPTDATLPPGPGAPRRLFLRRGEGTMKKYPDGENVKMPNEMFYRMMADEVPVPEKAELIQLDALTIPVAEAPGKTEVSFDAEGSGYGIRLRSVGGIQSALRPFPQTGAGEVNGLLFFHEGVRPAIPACIYPDRELMTGWVPAAHLSDLDAAARSSGLEVDPDSKTDLLAPFSRCNPTVQPSNLPPSGKVVYDVLWPLWNLAQFKANQVVGSGTVKVEDQKIELPGGPTIEADGTEQQAPTSLDWDKHFKEVECVGDALKTYQATVGNIYGSADCVQTQGHVEATARGSAPGVGPAGEAASAAGFSVSEGYSNVSVTRDPERGVVVTSTAIAKGIQIPGLTIGRVETKAVAWSNGRPTDAERASFTRTICGVVTPDYSNSRCLSTGEQKQLVDNWNTRWGVNSKMYLPTPDPDLYHGSPGGYIAGVIKPQADEIEDQLFSKDFQREVPGLVIEFRKDSIAQGFAVQSLQLAAVRAITGFGVQCNPDYLFSPQAKDCVLLSFDEEPIEEFEEEEEELFEDESELDGEWTEVEAIVDSGESLGARIGKLLEQLPILSGVPVREIAEALLLGSVWVLLGLPMLLAYRRMSLYPTRRS